MPKVKLIVLKSDCRSGLCRPGDSYLVDGVCPPLCHELWNGIYPFVYALLHGGELDCGEGKGNYFTQACPDGGRVVIHGEVMEE